MHTVEDIVALLGGPEAAATRLGIGTEAVRKWRQARAIPAKHWPVVLAATGLALDDLPKADTRKPRTETAVTDSTIPEGLAGLSAPEGATAALVLADGTVFWGRGFGAHGTTVAEICFNTSMTGYQEVLTLSLIHI